MILCRDCSSERAARSKHHTGKKEGTAGAGVGVAAAGDGDATVEMWIHKRGEGGQAYNLNPHHTLTGGDASLAYPLRDDRQRSTTKWSGAKSRSSSVKGRRKALLEKTWPRGRRWSKLGSGEPTCKGALSLSSTGMEWSPHFCPLGPANAHTH